MVVGLVAELVLAAVCALLMLALSIVTGLGRAVAEHRPTCQIGRRSSTR
jgi:hypothetical protein